MLVSHETIGHGSLRTGRSTGPRVTITGQADEPLELVLQYDVVRQDGGPGSVTLTFRNVLEYRCVDSDFEYYVADKEDFEFDLIEIKPSGLVELMARSGMHRVAGLGERLGGVVRESDVRHFRIGFDHYGVFDVLCLDLDVITE